MSIPKNWKKSPVSQACELIVDCVNKTAPVSDTKTSYRMVRTSNIRSGRLKLDDVKYVEFETYEKWTRRAQVIQGDILLTREAPIGEVAIIDQEKNLFLGQRIMQYRPDPKKINSRFLYYSFLSDDLQKQFNYHGDIGSTVSHIRVGDCSTFIVSIPPLREQCRIAEILGVWDESIDLLEKLIAAKRKLKQGLMQQLLTGKKRLKGFESGEWKKYKHSNVAQFYNGRAYKLSEWEEAGTPVIRLQNLTGTGKNFYYSNMKLPDHQYVNSGDLLYMWSATFGPHIWQGKKAIYHYHIWKVMCDENLLSKIFFYFLLDFETQQKMSKSNGMGILHITKSTMESTQIVLPPIKEQEKIAAILSAADAEISTLEKQLAAYKEQKRGLMQQLLTGRTRILGLEDEEDKEQK